MTPAAEETIDDTIRDVIQILYAISSSVPAYNDQSQEVLIAYIDQLVTKLAHLQNTSASLTASIPPEVIQFIEDARNPDIYTRMLMEGVQQSNAYASGKSEALASFRDCLADAMLVEWPEMEDSVRKVLEAGSKSSTVANGAGLARPVQTNGNTRES